MFMKKMEASTKSHSLLHTLSNRGILLVNIIGLEYQTRSIVFCICLITHEAVPFSFHTSLMVDMTFDDLTISEFRGSEVTFHIPQSTLTGCSSLSGSNTLKQAGQTTCMTEEMGLRGRILSGAKSQTETV